MSEGAPASEAIDVVYLPLRERARVGDWELIPREALVGDDCLDHRAAELAQGLAAIYAMLDPNPSPLLPEDERDLNAGHWMLTSDNATLVAHGVNREHGYTGTIVGSRVPSHHSPCPFSAIPKTPTSHGRRFPRLPTSASRP